MSHYKLFNSKSYADQRGYFFESFPRTMSEELGEIFYQDNISFSHTGVARGLHYQWENPMGKLVRAITGKIMDYIVDIRHGSPDYGKYWKFELSEENGNVLWVPPGYAHGFEALEDSHVMYKCSSYYSKDGESAISIKDPYLKIKLKTDERSIILSDKDLGAQSFKEYSSDPKFFYEEV